MTNSTSRTLTDLTADWLTERRAVGDTIAKATAIAYQSDMANWIRLISEQTGHEEPTLPDLHPVEIKTALAQMNDANKSAATRRRALTTLKGFVKWLLSEGHLEADPTASIATDRHTSSGYHKYFDDDDMGRILSGAVMVPDGMRLAWPALDLTIVCLLAGGGVRVSEAANLRHQDYNSQNPRLTVFGKGSKTRSVPLPPEIADVLNDYLVEKAEHELPCEPKDRLLVRPNGKPMDRFALDYRVNSIYKRAGVTKPEGESSHALRHTYATSMLLNGVPIADIRDLLGHESVATTSLYLKATAEHVRGSTSASSASQILRSGDLRRPT